MKVVFIRYISILIIALSLSLTSSAQVQVQSSLSGVEIFIGQQVEMTLEVSCDAQSATSFPLYQEGDTIIKGLEIVSISPADTLYLNNHSRKNVTQKYTITSFDTAFYYLPPIEIFIDSIPYKTESLALQVYTIPVDTLQTDLYFGPHNITSVPYSWKDDFAGPFYLSLLLFPFFILFIYLYVQYKDNKPIIRRVKVIPPLPPHIEASQRLQKVREEKRSWQDEDPKELYVQITDIVRHYMERRYGFHAMEMTSDEIMEILHDEESKENTKEINDLFLIADLVKFAKYKPLINEKDAHICGAISFVENTKRVEDEQIKTNEEIIVEHKRSNLSIIAIRITLVLLPLLIAGLLYCIMKGLYEVII